MSYTRIEDSEGNVFLEYERRSDWYLARPPNIEVQVRTPSGAFLPVCRTIFRREALSAAFAIATVYGLDSQIVQVPPYNEN
jgi:hypothetical protein